MSGEKRKRSSQDVAGSPMKRIATAHPPSESVKVSILVRPKEWSPVIAQTPGFSISNIPFKAYTSSASKNPNSTLLLHSSTHPRLDHTAQEVPNTHLNHYLAIFDPSSSTLQLIPSKTLTVRSTPRSTATQTPVSAVINSQSRNAARNALGLAFGTKKSQKAIRSLTENAFSPSKNFTKSSQALADAVVGSMPDDQTLTREAMQAEADDAKPRPKANLQAETPGEVYTIEKLVGGREAMRMVAVKEWIDTIDAGGEILVKSRFVAHRVEAVAQSGDVRKLKGLRYLLLLIEWYLALKPARAGGVAKAVSSKSIPKEPELSEKLPGWGQPLLSSLSRRFSSPHSPPGFLNTASMTLLLTTIFALTLCIDDQVTDTIDIREDLRLEQKQVNALYSELGATVAPLTEAERVRLGLGKVEARLHVTAMLKLPLQWPKLRALRAGGRR